MGKLVKFALLFMVLCLHLSNPAWAQEKGLAICFLLDQTGSYALQRDAIAKAQGIVAGLRPGDTFIVRRISESSYSHKNHILGFKLPQIPPEPGNRFDLVKWRAWNAARQKVEALRRQAIRKLEELKPRKAQRTDVWSGIQACQERLRAADDGNTRLLLLIATDGEDNVSLALRPDLKGIEVSIIVWDSGMSPTKAINLKKNWSKELLAKCGAKSVRFFHPDMPLHIKRK